MRISFSLNFSIECRSLIGGLRDGGNLSIWIFSSPLSTCCRYSYALLLKHLTFQRSNFLLVVFLFHLFYLLCSKWNYPLLSRHGKLLFRWMAERTSKTYIDGGKRNQHFSHFIIIFPTHRSYLSKFSGTTEDWWAKS